MQLYIERVTNSSACSNHVTCIEIRVPGNWLSHQLFEKQGFWTFRMIDNITFVCFYFAFCNQ